MKRFVTIVLFLALSFPLLSTSALGQSVDAQTGEIDGAPFRIQIPSEWNRNLIVYAHGYLPHGTPWRPLADVLSAVFLERGFAVAESGYSHQGWAVAEGIKETEALAYLLRYCTPTGVIEDPVLAVHTTYDPGVPHEAA